MPTHMNTLTLPQWEKTSIGVRQPATGHYQEKNKLG